MRLGKAKLAVIIVGSVLLVLFLAAGALVWDRLSRLQKEEAELSQLRADLDRLYDKDPFPTEENVRKETANLQDLRQTYDKFIEELVQGQSEPEKKTPLQFMDLYWKFQKDLTARAKANGIVVPEKFAFGFSLYREGVLPAATNVPRLLAQLVGITNLCDILYESGISELDQFGRDEFEKGEEAEAASGVVVGRGGRGGPEPSAPAGAGVGASALPEYVSARFHFTLGFRATESAMLKVMNRMASTKAFMVVTSLQMVSEEPGVMQRVKQGSAEEGGARDAAAVASSVATSAPAGPLPKDERIVSGVEKPMRVLLQVDVYGFARPAGEQKKDSAK